MLALSRRTSCGEHSRDASRIWTPRVWPQAGLAYLCAYQWMDRRHPPIAQPLWCNFQVSMFQVFRRDAAQCSLPASFSANTSKSVSPGYHRYRRIEPGYATMTGSCSAILSRLQVGETPPQNAEQSALIFVSLTPATGND